MFNLDCLFVWVLWHSNVCRLFNAKSIFIQKAVLFQTIQFSISTVQLSKTFLFQAMQFNQTVLFQTIQCSFLFIQLNGKTDLFQIMQFSIQKQFNFKQFT